MTKLCRLLMASTVLSSLAGLGTAHAATNFAATNLALPKADDAAQPSIVLAQATTTPQTEDEKRRQQQRQNQNQKQDQKQDNQQRRQDNQQQQQQRRQDNQQQQQQRRQDQQQQDQQRRQEQDRRKQEQQQQQQDQRRQEQDRRKQEQQQQQQKQQDNRGRGTTPLSPPPPPPAGVQGGTGGNQTTNSGNRLPSSNDKPIVSGGAGKGVKVESSGGQEIRRVDQLKNERRETKEGNRTIIREPDRTIIKEGNRAIIRHDENTRFRLGARDVRYERRGNDNVTIIYRPGGERIVTVLDGNGYLLRRSRFLPDGREIIIIDNRPRAGMRVGNFFVMLPPPRIRIPRDRYIVVYRDAPPVLLYDTLMAPPVDVIERPYSLDEIRYSAPLRDRMPRIDLDTVTFDSGSWELSPDQIDRLGPIADAMKRAIDQNPQTVFLVEGYTDAVGDENDNLSLSDRRAEAVAVALTEQFGVPAENLSTQGYGEQDLKVPTQGPEAANRRVTVRNIAPLLAGNNPPQQQQYR